MDESRMVKAEENQHDRQCIACVRARVKNNACDGEDEEQEGGGRINRENTTHLAAQY